MNKKISYSILILLILITMFNFILHPNLCIDGATKGLLLWFEKVLPSLLPFIILTNLLASLGIVKRICHKISPFTQKLFGLSGSSLFIFSMGLIAGYPTGAKLTAELLEQKQLGPLEAQKALCFSNNCGPLFIVGTVGTLLLQSLKLGYFLLFIHILSALTLIFLWHFYKPLPLSSGPSPMPSCLRKQVALSTLFNKSIQNGMDTIVYVGGYIIFFSVLVNLLAHATLFQTLLKMLGHLIPIKHYLLQSTLLGCLELSTGVATVAPLMKNSFQLSYLALIATFIGFGGFCVYFQSMHFLQGTSLKTDLYLFSKTLQGLFSALYVYLLYPLFFNTGQPLNYSTFIKVLFLLIASLFLSALFFKLRSKGISLKQRLQR